MNAHLGGRKAHLGMLYDETCRKHWAEMAAAGVPDFAARAFLAHAGKGRRARPVARAAR